MKYEKVQECIKYALSLHHNSPFNYTFTILHPTEHPTLRNPGLKTRPFVSQKLEIPLLVRFCKCISSSSSKHIKLTAKRGKGAPKASPTGPQTPALHDSNC